MALVKEIMGWAVSDRSSCYSTSPISSYKNINIDGKKRNNNIVIRAEEEEEATAEGEKGKRRFGVNKSRGAVAAISHHFVKFVSGNSAPKLRVRAVVTVRNKNKQDFKEAIAKQLDAFSDKIGRNVVLQLISTLIDPSQSVLFLFFYLLIYIYIY